MDSATTTTNQRLTNTSVDDRLTNMEERIRVQEKATSRNEHHLASKKFNDAFFVVLALVFLLCWLCGVIVN